MPGHYANPPMDNEARLARIVANLFRDDGWKVHEQPREEDAAPDFMVSGHGKKLVVEVKRASGGRKDRKLDNSSEPTEAFEAVAKDCGYPSVQSRIAPLVTTV
jgi:hypothetical protein